MPNCGCPDGYSFNSITGLCELLVDGPFSVGNNPKEIPTVCAERENMVFGTVIYPTTTPTQFPLIGQSTLSPSFLDVLGATLTPASSILSGNLWISGGSTSNGLLNLRGVGLPLPINTWYGVVGCVEVLEGHTLNFALSAKTAFRLYIDGILAIIYQPALPVKANSYLHIFPVTLSAGNHTYRAEALCDTLYSCNGGFNNGTGNFVFEIYDNVTPASLALITTLAGLNAVYATVFAGQTPALIAGLQFDVSSVDDYSNYYCPAGSILNSCSLDGAFTCPVLYTHPFVPCCFNLIECTTGAIIKTNTDLNSYIGHIIKIEEYPGCYLITSSSEFPCSEAISTTPTEFFQTCQACNQVYYKLTDCNGIVADVYTPTDLSSNVGLVIKISGYNDICWIVTLFEGTPSESAIVIVGSQFSSCESCLYVPPTPLPDPPFYHLSLVAIKTRAVQPGYGTGPCSTDIVENVNCNFAQQMYAKFNEQKYGVDSCFEEEFEKWNTKKRILELNLIFDSNVCKVNTCCAPCGILVNIDVFDIVQNTAPVLTGSSFVQNDIPYAPPTNPEAEITY